MPAFECVSLPISRQGGLHNVHLLPRDQRIGWIHHDLIVSLQSGNYFDLASEVVTRSEIGKLDLAIPYDTYLQALRPENQGADRNQKGGVRGRNVQVYFRIRTGQKSVAQDSEDQFPSEVCEWSR